MSMTTDQSNKSQGGKHTHKHLHYYRLSGGTAFVSVSIDNVYVHVYMCECTHTHTHTHTPQKTELCLTFLLARMCFKVPLSFVPFCVCACPYFFDTSLSLSFTHMHPPPCLFSLCFPPLSLSLSVCASGCFIIISFLWSPSSPSLIIIFFFFI